MDDRFLHGCRKGCLHFSNFMQIIMTYEQYHAMRLALITAQVVLEAQAKGQPAAPLSLTYDRQNQVDNAMAITALHRVERRYESRNTQ